MAGRKTERTVEVRVVQGALLNHEGRAYPAGATLTVSEADARALEAAGTAERLGGRRPR